MKNMRELALRLLCEWETEGKYLNLAVGSHLLDGISREERASITALLYTTVERKLSYDYYRCAMSGRSLSQIEPHPQNILRLGLCQILDMQSIPDFAAVNESVKLASTPGERSFVNGILRAAARRKDDLPMPPVEKNYRRYLSVKYSFPLATVKHFDNLYGRESTERMLDFFNNTKYLDITVNTNRVSVSDYLKHLKDAGYEAETNEVAPISIRLFGSVNPERLPGFAEGLFFVQDRASSISAYVLDPKAEEVIVDACSAPGGKTFSAAILSEGRAEIHSFDLHESKLSLISSGAERLGLHNIKIATRDALTPDEGLFGKADRVICDAPCSGLGVLGKKPDLRYKDVTATEELTALQRDILKATSCYLKVGGYMVYSTCTLNPEENEQIVNKFLVDNSDFELTPFTVGELSADCGMLTLLPHVHSTDGFFMAKIKRKI